MGDWITNFETTAEYNAALPNLETPHVSLTQDDMKVHYVPETRLVAKFNVTITGSEIRIASGTSNFSSIEIDGVVQPSVTTGYTFSTTGEHTVKYTLTDPTIIDGSALRQCSAITSIYVPESVTSIGQSSFAHCSGLTSIYMPDSVTTIGKYAFYHCSGLTSIDIPDGVTSIGSSAFTYCRSLTSIDIPSGVTSIGGGMCSACTSLTSCTIGSGVTSIGASAFRSCSSLELIISNAMTAPTIESNTFYSIKTGGTLTVPSGSSGYDVWMGTGSYYLGYYNWTKVEQ